MILYIEHHGSLFAKDEYFVCDKEGNKKYSAVGGNFLMGILCPWKYMLRIYNADGTQVAYVKRDIWNFPPKLDIFIGDNRVGSVSRGLTLFVPRYNVNYKDWRVEGEWTEAGYMIKSRSGREVASISTQTKNLRREYAVEVLDYSEILNALIFAFALEAEMSSMSIFGLLTLFI